MSQEYRDSGQANRGRYKPHIEFFRKKQQPRSAYDSEYSYPMWKCGCACCGSFSAITPEGAYRAWKHLRLASCTSGPRHELIESL